MARRNHQVIAVVIRQYGTGLYRTCVSLDRDDVKLLSTHQDERSADETIGLFWRAYDEGRLKTPADVTAFIDSLEPRRAAPEVQAPSPALPVITEHVFLPLAA